MYSRFPQILATLVTAVVFTSAATSAVAQSPRSAALKPVLGAPAGMTAFTNVSVIPMDRERVLANQTVLIEHGRILKIGAAKQVRIPSGATRIDGQGKFLIPGLADMHIHLFHTPHFPRSAMDIVMGQPITNDTIAEQLLFKALAHGITTVRNMDWLVYPLPEDNPNLPGMLAERNRITMQMRAKAAAGEILAPRMYTAGRWMAPPNFTIVPLAWRIAPADIAPQVTAYKAAGYDFIKPYYENGYVFDSVVAVAHRLGIPLDGHVPPGVTFDQALKTMKGIEHLTGSVERYGDTVDVRILAGRTAHAGVWNCPTQAHMVGHQIGDSVRRRAMVKALQDSSAGLLLGTDSPLEGPWIYRELQALVGSGLTPYQALLTGTRNVAEFFGTTAETGTVAVGKRADLVLLTGNPLVDVDRTEQPAGVMIGGRWVSRAVIDQRLAEIDAPAKEHVR